MVGATLNAMLISFGCCEPQAKGHIMANVNVGNDRQDLLSVATQLLPFIGYPRSLTAVRLIDETLPANPYMEAVRMSTTDFTLNNGVQIPAVGFGVFQTPPDDTRTAVTAALAAGYRHIDTAAAYGNERQVGEAVATSGIGRDEVFLETKIWISDYGYEQTLHGFDKSAHKLGVEQIDLLILHQALPSEFHKTLQAYRALETLLADGRVRAIGVSNFMVDHLTLLIDTAKVVPGVNQIEVHPYFTQRGVQHFGAEHGILTQAWSPIGRITFYRDTQHTSTLQDPVIGEIAQTHGKTPAQVMLRWHLQQGRSAIPKSTRPARIAENIDIFDFELTAEQLSAIDHLDTPRTTAGPAQPCSPRPAAAERRQHNGRTTSRRHHQAAGPELHRRRLPDPRLQRDRPVAHDRRPGPLHPRRPHQLAFPRRRPDPARHRWRRPRRHPGRHRRPHSRRRHRHLPARRRTLARRRHRHLHDPPGHARNLARRERPHHLARAGHRPAVPSRPA
jgi:diketogulonate reductase-like aldo/keto reductase